MFDIDLILTFALMALIFLRQMAVFKEPAKINYVPLLMGVGAIGALLHFLLYPDANDSALLLRESLITLFAGLVLTMVLYILTQASRRGFGHAQLLLQRQLLGEVDTLKAQLGSFNERLRELDTHSNQMQHAIRRVFKEEIGSFHKIEENQHLFMDKFEKVMERQKEILGSFEGFAKNEIPELDTIVHRHIEMLRIAEQDHFNQIKKVLERSGADEKRVLQALENLERSSEKLSASYETVSQKIIEHVKSGIGGVLDAFSRQLTLLRAQSEAIATTLSENEEVIASVRTQSELIMKQMVLSAKQMEEVLDQSAALPQVYEPLAALTNEVRRVKNEYDDARVKLGALSDSLKDVESFHYEKLSEHIERLSETLNERIEASLNELHEHYHIAQKDISKTVKELSAKANVQRSYREHP